MLTYTPDTIHKRKKQKSNIFSKLDDQIIANNLEEQTNFFININLSKNSNIRISKQTFKTGIKGSKKWLFVRQKLL